MTAIIINPGSGPVHGGNLKNATDNMKAFIEDVGIEGVKMTRMYDHDGNGRFAFILRKEPHKTLVEMPGLPLAQVRWMEARSGDIWGFPRLYIDKSSWFWKYAVNSARAALEGNGDDWDRGANWDDHR